MTSLMLLSLLVWKGFVICFVHMMGFIDDFIAPVYVMPSRVFGVIQSRNLIAKSTNK